MAPAPAMPAPAQSCLPPVAPRNPAGLALLPSDLLHGICLKVPLRQLLPLRASCTTLRSVIGSEGFRTEYLAVLEGGLAEAKKRDEGAAEHTVELLIEHRLLYRRLERQARAALLGDERDTVAHIRGLQRSIRTEDVRLRAKAKHQLRWGPTLAKLMEEIMAFNRYFPAPNLKVRPRTSLPL